MKLWVIYGVLSGSLLSVMAICTAYVLKEGVKPSLVNLSINGVVFLGFMILGFKYGAFHEVARPFHYLVMMIGGIAFCAALWFSTEALKIAPNPGYISALKSLQLVFIVFAAPLILGSEVSLMKIGGIVLVILGSILVSL